MHAWLWLTVCDHNLWQQLHKQKIEIPEHLVFAYYVLGVLCTSLHKEREGVGVGNTYGYKIKRYNDRLYTFAPICLATRLYSVYSNKQYSAPMIKITRSNRHNYLHIKRNRIWLTGSRSIVGIYIVCVAMDLVKSLFVYFSTP